MARRREAGRDEVCDARRVRLAAAESLAGKGRGGVRGREVVARVGEMGGKRGVVAALASVGRWRQGRRRWRGEEGGKSRRHRGAFDRQRPSRRGLSSGSQGRGGS